MSRIPFVFVVALVLCTPACSSWREQEVQQSRSSQSADAHKPAASSLTASERRRATVIARRWQRVGPDEMFVGATAFVTQGKPHVSSDTPNVRQRFLNVRVVWNGGAFPHSHLAPPLCSQTNKTRFEAQLGVPRPGTVTPPRTCSTGTAAEVEDGPRSAMFITFDEKTRRTLVAGSSHRNVGAGSDETLLYGKWPDPKDS